MEHVPNGRPTWHDLVALEKALRTEFDEDLRRQRDEAAHERQRWKDELAEAMRAHKQEMAEAMSRAHDFHSNANSDIMDVITRVSGKVDEHENFIQRLRGMTVLATFLVGTNLALVVLTALALFR